MFFNLITKISDYLKYLMIPLYPISIYIFLYASTVVYNDPIFDAAVLFSWLQVNGYRGPFDRHVSALGPAQVGDGDSMGMSRVNQWDVMAINDYYDCESMAMSINNYHSIHVIMG